MSSNIKLTREIAVQLLRQESVCCPNCEQEILQPRYRHKNQNIEYKCPHCQTIYHPCAKI